MSEPVGGIKGKPMGQKVGQWERIGFINTCHIVALLAIGEGLKGDWVDENYPEFYQGNQNYS